MEPSEISSDSTSWFEEAVNVNGTVAYENGSYVVYLDVLLASGGVRHRIGTWNSRSQAELGAREIVRNAQRYISAPPIES